MTGISFDVFDRTGQTTGSVDAPATLFGASHDDVQAHIPLVHQVVVGQLAAARQGTHATRNRARVSGGGKKPWKQKGTGRARQGSIRSPQWAGGAVAHGPVPRSYEKRTPKKMKAAALRYALSDRANAGRVHVVDFDVVGTPSTKKAAVTLRTVTEGRSTLVVLTRDQSVLSLSVRNLPGVHALFADQLNTYDVIAAEDVIFTREGLDGLSTAKSAVKAERVKEA